MSLYPRYLTRNFLLAFLAVSVIIASIVMVNFFDQLLEQIAAGNIDGQYLLPLIGSGFIRFFTFAFGTAACLGGTYLLTQMHQRHEITTWKSSGQGAVGILQLLMKIGLLLALISSIFFLWVKPASERYYAEQYKQARQSAESRLLSAQLFSYLPGIGQMYVAEYDKSSSAFKNSFLVVEDPTQHLKRITTSHSGNLHSSDRAFKVHKVEGQMVGFQKNKVVETLSFDTLDYINPRPVNTTTSGLPADQGSTQSLIENIEYPYHQLELGKRIGLILFVFNNTLLAGLLLFTKPRRSQIIMIFFIMILHLLYRYGSEWQLTINKPALLNPILWMQIPHVLFLGLFFMIWTVKREL